MNGARHPEPQAEPQAGASKAVDTLTTGFCHATLAPPSSSRLSSPTSPALTAAARARPRRQPGGAEAIAGGQSARVELVVDCE